MSDKGKDAFSKLAGEIREGSQDLRDAAADSKGNISELTSLVKALLESGQDLGEARKQFASEMKKSEQAVDKGMSQINKSLENNIKEIKKNDKYIRSTALNLEKTLGVLNKAVEKANSKKMQNIELKVGANLTKDLQKKLDSQLDDAKGIFEGFQSSMMEMLQEAYKIDPNNITVDDKAIKKASEKFINSIKSSVEDIDSKQWEKDSKLISNNKVISKAFEARYKLSEEANKRKRALSNSYTFDETDMKNSYKNAVGYLKGMNEVYGILQEVHALDTEINKELKSIGNYSVNVGGVESFSDALIETSDSVVKPFVNSLRKSVEEISEAKKELLLEIDKSYKEAETKAKAEAKKFATKKTKKTGGLQTFDTGIRSFVEGSEKSIAEDISSLKDLEKQIKKAYSLFDKKIAQLQGKYVYNKEQKKYVMQGQDQLPISGDSIKQFFAAVALIQNESLNKDGQKLLKSDLEVIEEFNKHLEEKYKDQLNIITTMRENIAEEVAKVEELQIRLLNGETITPQTTGRKKVVKPAVEVATQEEANGLEKLKEKMEEVGATADEVAGKLEHMNDSTGTTATNNSLEQTNAELDKIKKRMEEINSLQAKNRKLVYAGQNMRYPSSITKRSWMDDSYEAIERIVNQSFMSEEGIFAGKELKDVFPDFAKLKEARSASGFKSIKLDEFNAALQTTYDLMEEIIKQESKLDNATMNQSVNAIKAINDELQVEFSGLHKRHLELLEIKKNAGTNTSQPTQDNSAALQQETQKFKELEDELARITQKFLEIDESTEGAKDSIKEIEDEIFKLEEKFGKVEFKFFDKDKISEFDKHLGELNTDVNSFKNAIATLSQANENTTMSFDELFTAVDNVYKKLRTYASAVNEVQYRQHKSKEDAEKEVQKWNVRPDDYKRIRDDLISKIGDKIDINDIIPVELTTEFDTAATMAAKLAKKLGIVKETLSVKAEPLIDVNEIEVEQIKVEKLVSDIETLINAKDKLLRLGIPENENSFEDGFLEFGSLDNLKSILTTIKEINKAKTGLNFDTNNYVFKEFETEVTRILGIVHELLSLKNFNLESSLEEQFDKLTNTFLKNKTAFKEFNQTFNELQITLKNGETLKLDDILWENGYSNLNASRKALLKIKDDIVSITASTRNFYASDINNDSYNDYYDDYLYEYSRKFEPLISVIDKITEHVQLKITELENINPRFKFLDEDFIYSNMNDAFENSFDKAKEMLLSHFSSLGVDLEKVFDQFDFSDTGWDMSSRGFYKAVNDYALGSITLQQAAEKIADAYGIIYNIVDSASVQEQNNSALEEETRLFNELEDELTRLTDKFNSFNKEAENAKDYISELDGEINTLKQNLANSKFELLDPKQVQRVEIILNSLGDAVNDIKIGIETSVSSPAVTNPIEQVANAEEQLGEITENTNSDLEHQTKCLKIILDRALEVKEKLGNVIPNKFSSNPRDMIATLTGNPANIEDFPSYKDGALEAMKRWTNEYIKAKEALESGVETKSELTGKIIDENYLIQVSDIVKQMGVWWTENGFAIGELSKKIKGGLYSAIKDTVDEVYKFKEIINTLNTLPTGIRDEIVLSETKKMISDIMDGTYRLSGETSEDLVGHIYGRAKNRAKNTTPALPSFNTESTGQLAMQIEGVTEASWDFAKAEDKATTEAQELNEVLEGQITLMDYLADIVQNSKHSSSTEVFNTEELTNEQKALKLIEDTLTEIGIRANMAKREAEYFINALKGTKQVELGNFAENTKKIEAYTEAARLMGVELQKTTSKTGLVNYYIPYKDNDPTVAAIAAIEQNNEEAESAERATEAELKKQEVQHNPPTPDTSQEEQLRREEKAAKDAQKANEDYAKSFKRNKTWLQYIMNKDRTVGYQETKGSSNGEYGITKHASGKGWVIQDILTGMNISGEAYKTINDAINDLPKMISKLDSMKKNDSKGFYEQQVQRMIEHIGNSEQYPIITKLIEAYQQKKEEEMKFTTEVWNTLGMDSTSLIRKWIENIDDKNKFNDLSKYLGDKLGEEFKNTFVNAIHNMSNEDILAMGREEITRQLMNLAKGENSIFLPVDINTEPALSAVEQLDEKLKDITIPDWMNENGIIQGIYADVDKNAKPVEEAFNEIISIIDKTEKDYKDWNEFIQSDGNNALWATDIFQQIGNGILAQKSTFAEAKAEVEALTNAVEAETKKVIGFLESVNISDERSGFSGIAESVAYRASELYMGKDSLGAISSIADEYIKELSEPLIVWESATREITEMAEKINEAFTMDFGNLTSDELSKLKSEIIEIDSVLTRENGGFSVEQYDGLAEIIDSIISRITAIQNSPTPGQYSLLDKEYVEETTQAYKELAEAKAKVEKPTSPIKLDESAKASRNNWAWSDMGQFKEDAANGRYQSFLKMFDTSDMNEQQVAYFEQRAKSFAGLITEMYNDALRREASNPGSAFTGGSNFNVSRFYKKQDAMMKKQEEYEEKVSRFIENTKKGLKELLSEEEQLAIYREGRWNRDDDKISTNDPLALKKHEAKLEFLEKEHAEMLAYNKEARKAGKEQYPSWKLTYSNRAINEEKKTIEALKKLAEQGTEDIITAFTDGTKLIRSAVDNRVKFEFDGKPDDDTRTLLKGNGFRWAPSEGVWQRQWKTKDGGSSNSEYGVKKIVEALKLEEIQAEETAESEENLNKVRTRAPKIKSGQTIQALKQEKEKIQEIDETTQEATRSAYELNMALTSLQNNSVHMEATTNAVAGKTVETSKFPLKDALQMAYYGGGAEGRNNTWYNESTSRLQFIQIYEELQSQGTKLKKAYQEFYNKIKPEEEKLRAELQAALDFKPSEQFTVNRDTIKRLIGIEDFSKYTKEELENLKAEMDKAVDELFSSPETQGMNYMADVFSGHVIKFRDSIEQALKNSIGKTREELISVLDSFGTTKTGYLRSVYTAVNKKLSDNASQNLEWNFDGLGNIGIDDNSWWAKNVNKLNVISYYEKLVSEGKKIKQEIVDLYNEIKPEEERLRAELQGLLDLQTELDPSVMQEIYKIDGSPNVNNFSEALQSVIDRAIELSNIDFTSKSKDEMAELIVEVYKLDDALQEAFNNGELGAGHLNAYTTILQDSIKNMKKNSNYMSFLDAKDYIANKNNSSNFEISDDILLEEELIEEIADDLLKESATREEIVEKVENENQLLSDQAKFEDEFGQKIDENNERFVKGNKLINEQNKGILKLYHNSNQIFDSFDESKLGIKQGQAQGDGVYLATNPYEYNDSAYGIFQTEWYATTTKPLIKNAIGRMAKTVGEVFKGFTEDEILKIFREYYGTEHPTQEGYLRGKFSSAFSLNDGLNVVSQKKDQKPNDVLRFLGYDSIIDGNQIVIFDKNNVIRANDTIKSLDGVELSLEEATEKANALQESMAQLSSKYEEIQNHTLTEDSQKKDFEEHISLLEELLPLMDRYSELTNGKQKFHYNNSDGKYRQFDRVQIEDSIGNFKQIIENRFPVESKISSGTTAPLQQVEDKLEEVEQQAKKTSDAINEIYRGKLEKNNSNSIYDSRKGDKTPMTFWDSSISRAYEYAGYGAGSTFKGTISSSAKNIDIPHFGTFTSAYYIGNRGDNDFAEKAYQIVDMFNNLVALQQTLKAQRNNGSLEIDTYEYRDIYMKLAEESDELVCKLKNLLSSADNVYGYIIGATEDVAARVGELGYDTVSFDGLADNSNGWNPFDQEKSKVVAVLNDSVIDWKPIADEEIKSLIEIEEQAKETETAVEKVFSIPVNTKDYISGMFNDHSKEILNQIIDSTQPDKNGVSSGAASAPLEQVENKAKGVAITVEEAFRGIEAVTDEVFSTERPFTFFSQLVKNAEGYAGKLGTIFKTKLDFKNAFVMDDISGSTWNNIQYLGDKSDEASIKINDLANNAKDLIRNLSKNTNLEAYDLNQIVFGNSDTLSKDVFSSRFTDILSNLDNITLKNDTTKEQVVEWINALKNVALGYKAISDSQDNIYGTHSTDEFAKRIFASGDYDGIVFKDIFDVKNNGDISDVYVAKQKESIVASEKTTQEYVKQQKRLESVRSQIVEITQNIVEEKERYEELVSLMNDFNAGKVTDKNDLEFINSGELQNAIDTSKEAISSYETKLVSLKERLSELSQPNKTNTSNDVYSKEKMVDQLEAEINARERLTTAVNTQADEERALRNSENQNINSSEEINNALESEADALSKVNEKIEENTQKTEENNNAKDDAINKGNELDDARRRMLSTNRSVNYEDGDLVTANRTATYTETPGRKVSISQGQKRKFNKETKEYELVDTEATKVTTNYTTILNSAIKAQNRLNKEIDNYYLELQKENPNVDRLLEINNIIEDQIRLLSDARRAANQYFEENGNTHEGYYVNDEDYGTKYYLSQFDEDLDLGTRTSSAEERIRLNKELLIQEKQKQQEIAKTARLENYETAEINKLNNAVDKTNESYNGNKKPLKDTSAILDVLNKELSLRQAINDLERDAGNLTKEEFDARRIALEYEQEQLDLLVTHYKNQEYSSTAMSPKDLKANKDNLDLLADSIIKDAKLAGDFTSSFISDVNVIKTSISSLKDSNGIKDIYDQLINKRKELGNIKKDERLRIADENNTKNVLKTFDDAIKKVKEQKDLINEIESKIIDANTNNKPTNKLNEDLDIAKSKLHELETAAEEALKPVTKLLVDKKISRADYNKNVQDYYDSQNYQGRQGSLDDANEKARIKSEKEEYDDLISSIKELTQARKDLQALESKARKNPTIDYSQEIEDQKAYIRGLESIVNNQDSLNIMSRYSLDSEEFKEYTDAVNNASKAEKELNNQRQLFGEADEKAALDEYKKSLEELSKAYKTFANDSKGKRSVTLQEDAQQVAMAEQRMQEMRQAAIDAGVSVAELDKITEDSFRDISTSIGSIGSKTIDEYISKIDALSEKMQKDGTATEETVTKLEMLKQALYGIQQSSDLTTNEGIGEYLLKINQAGATLPSTLANIEAIGRAATELSNINTNIASFENMNLQTSKAKSLLAELKAQYESLKESIANSNGKFVSQDQIDQLNRINSLIKQISKQAYGKGSLVPETKGFVKDVNSLASVMKDYANDLGYTKQIGNQVTDSDGNLRASFKNSEGQVLNLSVAYNQLEKGMNVVSQKVTQSKGLWGMLGGTIGGLFKQFTYFFSGYHLAMKFWSSMREGFNTVKDLDSALTEMRKVSDESMESLKQFQDVSFSLGQSVGKTAYEIQQSAADFMRLGYSLKDAAQLAKDANIYSNVGDMEIDEATEHMISSIKAWGSEFNSEVEASSAIIDKYNEIKFYLSLCT